MNTFDMFLRVYAVDSRLQLEVAQGFIWYHCRATGVKSVDMSTILQYYQEAGIDPPESLAIENEYQIRRNGVVRYAGRFRLHQSAEGWFRNKCEDDVFGSGLPVFAITERISEPELKNSISVPHGAVFDYFNQLRRLIATAKFELFFVDPYLDAAFVARYLREIPASVSVRILGRKGLPSLIPGVDLLFQQTGLKIELRKGENLHDRYLFIDNCFGFQSGASFKDGARNAPTAIVELTSELGAILADYESIWTSATPTP